MAILKILNDKSPELRKTSREVEKINRRILTLLDDMRDTLRKIEGYGLAAPQVGVLRRVAIIDSEDGLIEMINPEIICAEGEQTEIEGCLSSPGRAARTRRPQKVKIRFLDREGTESELTGEGLLARGFCHEIDHLNGILCFDNAIRVYTEEELEEMKEENGKNE